MTLMLITTAKTWAQVDIKIDGIEGTALDNVRNSLSIRQQAKDTPKTLSDGAIRRYHKKAQTEIKRALQPFGYYQPTIQSELVQSDKKWKARYHIISGPQTTIQQVQVDVIGPGKQEAAIQALVEKPTLMIGSPLNHQQYENYKQALFNTLFSLGYLDATYEKSQLRVDIQQHKADIVLTLNSGKQYFFGDINIEQSTLRDSLVDALVDIQADTPFNADDLLGLQLKLMDTGFFASTDIQIQRDKAIDHRIPVTIRTTPSKKLKLSTSVGYGTDTGPRLGLSFLNRRVNKRGHNVKFSIRISAIESHFNTQYIIPIGDINTESIDYFISANQEAVNDSESEQFRVGSSLNQNRWGGRQRLSLTLLREQFSFDDEANRTANLLIPKLQYTHQKADNALFTRKGYKVAIDLHGGIESNISETTFFHTRLSSRAVTSLNQRSRLLTRLEAGAISTDEFDELPPSERFFTGGAQSVRGYDYKDIGPRNAFNNNIGGEYLIAGSLEVDYLVWKDYGFAVFYDAGDVAADTQFDLKKSAGIGFRYRSAIGMIRLDFAHPLDDPDEDFRFHISIGPDL